MNSTWVSKHFIRSVRWQRLLEMDEQTQTQARLARLEANVEHIQSDVADIKTDLRRTNDKIEGLRQELTRNSEGARGDLTQKIEGVREELTQKIDGLRQDMYSLKVWALGLYIALAGSLLIVMAKGFKWL